MAVVRKNFVGTTQTLYVAKMPCLGTSKQFSARLEIKRIHALADIGAVHLVEKIRSGSS